MTTRTASKSGKKKGSAKSKATNARVRTAAAPASRRSSGASFRFPLFNTDERLVEKKSRRKSGTSSVSGGAVRKTAKDYERMPSWRELESKSNTRVAKKGDSTLDSISTVSMAAIIVTVVAVFTLYIGHVHATQEELARFQRLQTENANLHLKLNRVKGEYDGMTGPAQVYDRARQIGLVENEARVPPVIVSPR